MTCAELATIITKRIITRAQEEPDPVAYFSRAVARAVYLVKRAEVSGHSIQAELLEFGREFGLLVQGIEKQN
jgi:hypothetical protein